MSETIIIDDWVSEYNTMCPFIERFSDVSKAFLACSIPDIKGYLVIIKFNAFDFKVHTDGAEVISLKIVFTISN